MALTPRQHEVTVLVARGCTNREIASYLGVTPHAVKKHVSRILELFHASNRTELAAMVAQLEHPRDNRVISCLPARCCDMNECRGG